MSSDIPMDPSLVLITGAGRSGTSTMAGTLFRLGYHVPEPYMQGNESNPRGFYESWWPVRFHKRLIARANVEQTDGRPEAVDLVREVVDGDARAELSQWLSEVTSASDRVVVKDPRAVWASWLWSELAGEAGVNLTFLTMLRHPAEVIGSRNTYYADYRSWMAARDFATMNLCGWINGNLIVERQTRDQPRSFVLYDDLLVDWRKQAEKLAAEIAVAADLSAEPASLVDDFIEPSLRRHEPDWGELEIPVSLREIAEEVFDAFVRLSAAAGHDEDIHAEIDEIAARYQRLYADSAAIAQDAASARARVAKAEGARKARKRAQQKQAGTAGASAQPVSMPRALARTAMQHSALLRRMREGVRR
ncbi:MAG: hypothetical protein L0H93_09735 [Nocardioides sp.]|nr:hypothetical protein [Nocardioides sp.]